MTFCCVQRAQLLLGTVAIRIRMRPSPSPTRRTGRVEVDVHRRPELSVPRGDPVAHGVLVAGGASDDGVRVQSVV